MNLSQLIKLDNKIIQLFEEKKKKSSMYLSTHLNKFRVQGRGNDDNSRVPNNPTRLDMLVTHFYRSMKGAFTTALTQNNMQFLT